MILLGNKRFRLKDISVADQDAMGLEWAWKAGAVVTYIRDYERSMYSGSWKSCSLITVSHLKSHQVRELWVFDMFLEGVCIWNS